MDSVGKHVSNPHKVDFSDDTTPPESETEKRFRGLEETIAGLSHRIELLENDPYVSLNTPRSRFRTES